MLKAIIVDNDPVSRHLINEIVKHYCSEVEVIEETDSLYSGIKAIQQVHPDLVFLDVELPDGKGFDLLNILFDYSFKVVFITAYKEHVYNAMKFNPVDFLVKPISPCDVIKAVQKASYETLTAGLYRKRKTKDPKIIPSDKIVIKTVKRIFLKRKDQIIRCEAVNNHTRIVLKDQTEIISIQNLKWFENQLNTPEFLRIHSSHLVNSKYIRNFDKSEEYIVMADNSKVPVSLAKKELILVPVER